MDEKNEAKFDEIEEKDISLRKSMNVSPLPKQNSFSVDWVWKKLNGRHEAFRSREGDEVSIKAVA